MYKQWYVVFYKIKHTRMTGSYLVHAKSKTAAVVTVREINPTEYVVGLNPYTFDKYFDEFGVESTIDEEFQSTVKIDKDSVPFNAAFFLECGT